MSDAYREVIAEMARRVRQGQTEADEPRDPRPRVLIAICHNLGVVERDVTISLMNVVLGNRIPRAKELYGLAEISAAWFTNHPRVDALRNAALDQAMRDGFTHVLFLDADMLQPDDLLQRMLRHVGREAVVSGLYFQRCLPFAPIAMRNGTLHASGRYSSYEADQQYFEVDAEGLRDEEVVGMGCALIPLAIVRALGPRPWFEYKDDIHGWPMVSEDVPFCERVRAAGYRIVLDPSIKCGHLYRAVADEAHFRRYLQVRAATEAQLKDVVTIRVDEGAAAEVAP